MTACDLSNISGSCLSLPPGLFRNTKRRIRVDTGVTGISGTQRQQSLHFNLKMLFIITFGFLRGSLQQGLTGTDPGTLAAAHNTKPSDLQTKLKMILMSGARPHAQPSTRGTELQTNSEPGPQARVRL